MKRGKGVQQLLCGVLALILLLGLGACASESESGPEPVLAADDPFKDFDQEPSAPPTWRHGSRSDDQALLEAIRAESDLGDIWWLNGEAADQLCGEDVWADGSYHKGVFVFRFQTLEDWEEISALTGQSQEELFCRAWRWPWETWGYMAKTWEFCVTIQPIQGEWPTPDHWIPPENRTYGDDLFGCADGGPESGLIPEGGGADGQSPATPQPTSQYEMPQFAPAEGHEGCEMAVVHATPEGTPRQVRFRWKTEDGFGCWAQVPGWAVDRFFEYFDQWFVKVDTGTEGTQ